MRARNWQLIALTFKTSKDFMCRVMKGGERLEESDIHFLMERNAGEEQDSI